MTSSTLPAQTPVLIIGAGPVGLALAIDLASRGVACVIIDQGDGIIRHSKMGAVSVRTMEFCRRWGLAEQVRNSGFPNDYELSQVFCTSLTGHLIGKSEYPSMGKDPPSPASPEHRQRCPQIWFDPILMAAAASHDDVTLRHNCTLVSFIERDNRVLATIKDNATGTTSVVEALYMVGCDGAGSSVRNAVGVKMVGEDLLNYSVGIYFRSPTLLKQHDKGEAERYIFVGEDGNWGHLTAVDGREFWRLTVMGGQEHFDMKNFDSAQWVNRCIGRNGGDYEVVSVLPWRRAKLVAEYFRAGRVFLCGDAVHVMSPNGGYGMNTGICDAVDLGWKLHAVLSGWAPSALLDSYEIERRPVGVRNTYAAASNFNNIVNAIDWSSISADTGEGARKRREVGKILEQSGRGNMETLGISLGYRYEQSPLCVADGTPATPDEPRDYVPTSRPGHRAPHAWIEKGRSILDLFGDGFVALRFGDAVANLSPLEQVANARGVPLRIATIHDPDIARLYEAPVVLVRPDGHVAWRGNTSPKNPDHLIDVVRGASTP